MTLFFLDLTRHLCIVKARLLRMCIKSEQKMKKNTIISAALVAVMLASTVGTFANVHRVKSTISAATVEGKKLNVVANRPEASAVRVEIRDAFGIAQYDGTENSGQFNKQYNLAALAEGNYTLTLSTDQWVSVQPFSIAGANVLLSTANYQEVVKVAVAQLVNNRFVVQANTKNVPLLGVSLVNSYGEVVHTDTVTEAKQFNLNKLPKGKYAFVVSLGNKEITQNVVVK